MTDTNPVGTEAKREELRHELDRARCDEDLASAAASQSLALDGLDIAEEMAKVLAELAPALHANGDHQGQFEDCEVILCSLARTRQARWDGWKGEPEAAL